MATILSAFHLCRASELLAAPNTTRAGRWADANPSVYVGLRAGADGLPFESTALLDQVGSIDVRRIQGYLGMLTNEDFRNVIRKDGLVGKSQE